MIWFVKTFMDIHILKLFLALSFQDPVTPVMMGIVDLYHYVRFYSVIILFFVLTMFVEILVNFYQVRGKEKSRMLSNLLIRISSIESVNVSHSTTLEIVWTIIPSLILALIAVPSFVLPYAMDEVIDPILTVKIIGHQWYWVYDYTDLSTSTDLNKSDLVQSSYILPTMVLEEGDFRLLEVDKSSYLPVQTQIRLIVTASDVLHSWAVPQFGVKMDAVPGRLNAVPIFVEREGIYYGQCSEICGVYHGFMPIRVEVVPVEDYFIELLNFEKHD